MGLHRGEDRADVGAREVDGQELRDVRRVQEHAVPGLHADIAESGGIDWKVRRASSMTYSSSFCLLSKCR